MTKRLDFGVWIAGASALVIAGAVVAGLMVAGNPADVRAERIDDATLARMNQVASAAQCAFTYTGEVPGDFAAIETALRERRRAVPACDHLAFSVRDGGTIAYTPVPPERIELCAVFERPSRGLMPAAQGVQPLVIGTDFPELREPRPRAGRHCYSVRLVDQAPASP